MEVIKRKKSIWYQNCVLATSLGPLHDGDPLLVVTEEGEIEVRRGRVRLRADRQLRKHALPVERIK